MTQEYLIGELSVRLEELQAATTCDAACDVTRQQRRPRQSHDEGLMAGRWSKPSF